MNLTPSELDQILSRKTIRDRNPDLAGGRNAVGPMEADRAKRAPLSPLECSLQKPAGSQKSLDLLVTLTTYRRRLLDGHDAVAYACKPLTDAIAATLGCDDADNRITWAYHQIKTTGAEGVTVRIERRVA